MPETLQFSSASPRHGLPLLFAGQAQKEIIVNEALSRIDALLHLVVEGELDTPPSNPAEGACWLIGPSPSGTWAERSGQVACYSSGDWLFLLPRPGLRCWNAASGSSMVYINGWTTTVSISSPSGGSTVDSQARQAIDQIISGLVNAGIIPA